MAKRGAGAKDILNGSRATVVNRVARILETGEPTKFALMATCRHGLRVAFIGAGNSWATSNSNASRIVLVALAKIGAKWPRWDEGQPGYTEPGVLPIKQFYCARCGRRLDGGYKYCSLTCKRAVRNDRSVAGGWKSARRPRPTRRPGGRWRRRGSVPTAARPSGRRSRSRCFAAISTGAAPGGSMQHLDDLEDEVCGWCGTGIHRALLQSEILQRRVPESVLQRLREVGGDRGGKCQGRPNMPYLRRSVRRRQNRQSDPLQRHLPATCLPGPKARHQPHRPVLPGLWRDHRSQAPTGRQVLQSKLRRQGDLPARKGAWRRWAQN